MTRQPGRHASDKPQKSRPTAVSHGHRHGRQPEMTRHPARHASDNHRNLGPPTVRLEQDVASNSSMIT
ncbi:hypothetical protein RRG08_023305 [Elysia crispata]|uniref:Uncharacterized protein n=1 Tax=Elysia crispata TaxID=231223 RepID=A0AAE1BCG0_9GAST|nr:hypothetical protein RRG08_023305 [Elysia crispata]